MIVMIRARCIPMAFRCSEYGCSEDGNIMPPLRARPSVVQSQYRVPCVLAPVWQLGLCPRHQWGARRYARWLVVLLRKYRDQGKCEAAYLHTRSCHADPAASPLLFKFRRAEPGIRTHGLQSRNVELLHSLLALELLLLDLHQLDLMFHALLFQAFTTGTHSEKMGNNL